MPDVTSPALKPKEPFRVFISYARKDQAFLDELLRHLKNLVRSGWIEPWCDRMFRAGDTWEETLTEKLLATDLILMLVSPHFMHSEFIHQVELKTALERAEAHEVKIVPILVTSVDMEGHALDRLQSLPHNRTPLDLWPNRNEAWLSVVKELRTVLLDRLPHQAPPVQIPSEPMPTPPIPAFEAPELRELTQSLEAARARVESLETSGGPELEQARQTVQVLKERLRNGTRLLPGMWLDERYQLVSILGRGGFSIVWLAVDKESDTLVAVKVLKPDALSNPTTAQRFQSGVRAMLTLRHPHIVQVKEPFRKETHVSGREALHYGVLELAQGDFQQYIEQHDKKKPALGPVLRIVWQIAQALEHAHGHRVSCIHRDVKPGNILLMADGTAKLTDFDLARLGDSTHGTRSGALGTFLYSAPELVRQRRRMEEERVKADPRMDIYSLSVTLLTGLRGREPEHFPERVEPELALPPMLRTVLEKGLAEAPEQRFPTMRAFREALERALEAHLTTVQDALELVFHEQGLEQALQEAEHEQAEFRWWQPGMAMFLNRWLGWLEKLEAAEDWSRARWLVARAAHAFPEVRRWVEDQSRLEAEQRVAQDYLNAMEALRAGRTVEARRLLLEVLRHHPDYKDSAQQLFMALSGVDPEQLKGELVAADQRVGSLSQQVTRLEGEVSRLKREGQSLQTSLSEKESALQKQSGALKTLHEELSASQGKQTATQEELERVKKSLTMAMTEQENLKRVSAASLAQAKQEKAAAEESASQSKTRAEQAEQQLSAEKAARAQAEASRTRAEAGKRAARGMAGVLSLGLVGSLGLSGYLWLSRPATMAQTEAPEVITWVSVPPTGPDGFWMGSPDNVGESDERPRHQVKIPAFQMSKTEVTVAQYRACFDAKGSGCTEPLTGSSCNWKVEGRDNHPINCVDWFQAKAYAAWLSGVMGQTVGLPSEAQWEYAARGPESRTYPWGEAAPTPERANYGYNVKSTTQVGQYPEGASWVGALDMAGNVWEWVEDCYEGNYNDAPNDGSARTVCSGSNRVLRGGSWRYDASGLRGANRNWHRLSNRSGNVGFRVVWSAPRGAALESS
ncbi:MAG: SUMF1/EgtB/PvdO family nonheme iron enzyme, partial [Myxococcota bacterium]